MKEQKRKPPKRKPTRIKLDDDLTELAAVLDEYRLDNNAHGWFRTPWRDGWNAVELAFKAWCLRRMSLITSEAEDAAQLFLVQTLAAHSNDDNPALYWGAGEHIRIGWQYQAQGFLYASLRCLQVMTSFSSGGGEVYNDILCAAFSRVDVTSDIEDLVLEFRCRDAIGTTAHLQGDRFDRQRRAFSIAWKRGLYIAAYSISPTLNVGKVTIHKDDRV